MGKCVRTAAKTLVCGQKKIEGTSSVILFGVRAEFAAEPTTKMKSSKAHLVT